MSLNIVPTLGALLIGDLISVCLYGFTTFQTYFYFHKSWYTDPWKLKSFVFWVWLLETWHACLICSYIFRALILEANDPAEQFVTKASDDLTTLATTLIIFSVHIFYIRRLWIVSDRAELKYRLVITIIVTALAVCHLALGVTVMSLEDIFPDFSQFHHITGYYTVALALAAADDILIALGLSYVLTGRRTGIKNTQTLIDRIITFTITTGALTSVIDVIILICFVVMPNNLVYLALYNIINNLYANSLLAMLNARESLSKINNHVSTSVALRELGASGTSSTQVQQRDIEVNLHGNANRAGKVLFAPFPQEDTFGTVQSGA